ncbi:MAG: kynurenine 3-monooxygenase [Bacteroidetes bacterium]|nr:kynurenine 3-monooxygenase [Bacteroidota bacterium]
MTKNFTIIGSGLVGSVLACYLAKRGHTVSIYERRSDMRQAGYIGGRSINLALSNRGWAALDKIGLSEKIAQISIPMTGRMVHNLDGTTAYIPYGKDGQAIYSVSRGELNIALINEAEKNAGVKFHFDELCTHVNFDSTVAQFTNTQTNQLSPVKSDYIFASDGAFSAVRYEMQKTPQFNFSQTYEEYGYKELTIPAAVLKSPLGDLGADAWSIEKNALHIWPRKSFMMIALPNLDGSFTCTLFAPYKGENSFETIQTPEAVEAYFQKNFPTALAQMPTLKKDFFENPIGSLVTMKCFPWVYKNTALIGDAAHAVVPFYGQGMNCGFEDVDVLDDILTASGENWQEALDKYQYSRKPNADAIADLALYNYIEMRDLSGQPEFQLRLKIEKHIAAHFPQKFNTLYSMVTFDRVPYAEAQQKAAKQGKLLDEIMRLDNIADKWDSAEVMTMADKWIAANT